MVSDNQLQNLIGVQVDQSELIGSNENVLIHKITSAGSSFCMKSAVSMEYDSVGVKMLESEFTGLELLRQAKPELVPGIRFKQPGIIVMEWIQPGHPSTDSWELLGHGLAHIHQTTHHRFGLDQNGFCGNNPQINHWCNDGIEFFISMRIEPQLKMAVDNRLLTSKAVESIRKLNNLLPDLIPRQPAVLVHGDLWRGNVVFGNKRPYLIDPSVYYGWAEADLAMTFLFGRFDPGFYAAYENVTKLHPGFHDRKDLYNCYHLLNHLNLFGSGYHDSLMQIVNRYTGIRSS